jgi:hypothetical protein
VQSLQFHVVQRDFAASRLLGGLTRAVGTLRDRNTVACRHHAGEQNRGTTHGRENNASAPNIHCATFR